MSIRIVTHCYANQLPQYAVDLRYQLSSLVLYPPKVPISFSLCCAIHDEATQRVYYEFQPKLNIERVLLSPENLFRRSIGRNQVALGCQEELIWFADADYVFHRGCLDQLFATWRGFAQRPVMMWPTEIMAHVDHAAGDALIEPNREVRGLLELDTGPFSPMRVRKAIGGLQIVNGEFASRHGYLKDNERYQKPWNGGPRFHTTEDAVYRHYCNCHGDLVGITLEGLYRIRHFLNAYQKGRQPATTQPLP